MEKFKKIVIIGGGFGAIELFKKLENTNYKIVVLDKNNYHTFQPLLYQVATGGLEPGSIAYPIRKLLHNKSNITFRMAEAKKIFPDLNKVVTDIGDFEYDILVIATGSKTNFFSFDENTSNKMHQLKSINQALDIRSFILENFEKALIVNDSEKEELMNIAIVGGGPTGVELAGALGEMKNSILPKDYPELDFKKMNVYLFEASSSLLLSMRKESQNKALKYLNNFGVKVELNTIVDGYDGHHLTVNKNVKIPTQTVIWAAGVKANSIEGLNSDSLAKNGRIKVDNYNKVLGYDNIYSIGDVAIMEMEKYSNGHPMVAPVAMQQGELLGKNLINLLENKPLKQFSYFDKGAMATVGRNKAVVDFPNSNINMGGFMAWVAWMLVHMLSLIGFRNKLIVFIGWIYNYIKYDRTLRLIIRPSKRKD
jgi:NADH dehydrogenase